MNRSGKITGAAAGIAPLLAIAMLPHASPAADPLIAGGDGGRDEWHGPGDPEGGDRCDDGIVPFDHVGVQTEDPQDVAADASRETVPSVRLVPVRGGYLLIVRSGDVLRTYPILLSR